MKGLLISTLALVASATVQAHAPEFSAALQQYGADLRLACARRISYVTPARHLRQAALATPGADLSDADALLVSYIVALSAEVDAKRMTPEMLVYKIQERVQQNKFAQQQARQVEQLQVLQTLQTLQVLRQRTAPPVMAGPPTYQMLLSPIPRTCSTMANGAVYYTTRY